MLSKIPKILHYVWLDFKDEHNINPEIPQKYLENINLCKTINHNYIVKIWKGQECFDFVRNYFPEYYEIFINFKYPIIRCDVVRLMILYIYGGIYVDMDRICQKSYDILLNKYSEYDLILSKIPFYQNLNNDIIIAKKNDHFIFNCIQNIKDFNTSINIVDVFIVAGPIFLTKQYLFYYGKSKIKIISDELNPCSLCTCNNNISNSISYSTSDNTWLTPFEKNIRYILCNLHIFLFIILLAIAIFFANKKYINIL